MNKKEFGLSLVNGLRGRKTTQFEYRQKRELTVYKKAAQLQNHAQLFEVTDFDGEMKNTTATVEKLRVAVKLLKNLQKVAVFLIELLFCGFGVNPLFQTGQTGPFDPRRQSADCSDRGEAGKSQEIVVWL